MDRVHSTGDSLALNAQMSRSQLRRLGKYSNMGLIPIGAKVFVHDKSVKMDYMLSFRCVSGTAMSSLPICALVCFFVVATVCKACLWLIFRS